MFGLRAVRAVFRRKDTPVEVTLFPMLHVGEERFYAEVYEDALQHDAVLYEGVGPLNGIHIAKAYRWMKPERLQLVVQPKFPIAESETVPRLVRADLGPEEFMREWRKVPLLQRIFVQVGAPIYGLLLRFTATRESLAKKRGKDDKMSGDEILDMFPAFEALKQCIVHSRDARLLEHLRSEIDSYGGAPKRIAIVYGAGHMRAVIRGLTGLGYRCAEARWLSIFKL